MKVKDIFLSQLCQFGTQARSAVSSALDTPLITQGLSCAAWLLMGQLLAQGQIGGQCTPFGLGLVGAAGPGAGGAAALVGVCLGAVSAAGLTDGLRYAAIAVLIYAVAFAFYDSRLFRTFWFMPLIAGGIDLLVGIPLLSEQHWIPRAMGLLLLEGALTAGAVWCFRRALFPAGTVPGICTDLVQWFRKERTEDPVQAACLFLLAAALLSALARFTVEGLSPARCAALTAVLLLGAYYSPEAGACVGVLFGFAVDLPLAEAPYHTALFCLSGMAAGFSGRRHRLRGAAACLASALLVSMAWVSATLVLVVEAAFAGGVFLLLPRRWFSSVRQREVRPPTVPAAIPAMVQVRDRLDAQSAAFRSIYDNLRISLSEAGLEPPEPMLIFIRASERVCVSCIKYNRCWRQQYSETRASLTGAFPRLLKRGHGISEDFPPQFTERCAHFSAYLTAVNQELANLLAQRQFQAKVRESRAAVCCQYQELAQLLSAAAAELSARPQRDNIRTRKLEGFLRGRGIPAQGRVIYGPSGHLMVELLGGDLSLADQPEIIEALTGLLSLPLRRGSLSAEPEGQCLTLVQLEPYSVSAGIASQPRDGNSISGDTCRWFKGEDGILRVILCDGMGCGKGAARESKLVIRLLERLLQADLEPESALRTICGAMGLRSEAGGGYSTIDLLTIDLFSCQSTLYKLGAAPSYLCRDGQVHRISGGALPAGATGASQAPAVTHLPLGSGDTVLLISDGTCDGLDDDWLRKALLNGGNLDSRSLALALLNLSSKQGGSRDDRTAVVLRISKRLK